MSWILLEGGGFRTWAGLTDPDATAVVAEVTGPSTNLSTVGEPGSARLLRGLIRHLATGHSRPIQGILAAHSAAATSTAAQHFATLIHEIATRLGILAPIWVTSNITPLLLLCDSPAVIAATAGTGTGFAARHGGSVARASGLSWQLSDEGGAHDLALAGLRAVTRASDHRGPATALTAAAHEWLDLPADESLTDALFDTVHVGGSYNSTHIAAFAYRVLHAADNTDPVASALVDAAALELALGVIAVSGQTDITETTPASLVVSGSLLNDSASLRERLVRAVQPHLALQWITQVGPDNHAHSLLTLHHHISAASDTFDSIASAIPTYHIAPQGDS
ncbi:BadF/BadG/BcrA/BcrD ATPase family protein [Nocardia altamirensis]|uniref:BadF/BadG/BcrA/BcrD ATPase family protein n=1 Tax=Nocardia altamirensis TaxID=472158 RepID=UPI0008404F18|nr:BadF/BadG/BcrA/BcrD ATPase family protein [Nocardia altamirensis]